MSAPAQRALAMLCALPVAVGLGACAKSVSTSAFSGEQHDVAQAVANLQSDVTAGDQQKICSRDLARSVLVRLNAARGGCKAALKDQLAEIDNLDVTVESVTLSGSGPSRSATAVVRSTFAGKKRRSTLSLVSEGGKWKISGVS